jgi:hypothetical protein
MVRSNTIQTGNRGTPGKKSTSNVHIGKKVEDVLTGNSVPFSLRCSLQKSSIAKKINGKKREVQRQVRTKMYKFVNSRMLETMA